MRDLRFLALFVLSLSAASCAGSHAIGGDAGPPRSDATVAGDAGPLECGPAPGFFCVSGTPGGACGDAGLMPVCAGGAWGCPAGTIPSSECRCFGPTPPDCVCGATGWECGRRAERFSCGPDVTCERGAQYCIHVLSDVSGFPDDYRCELAPIACEGRATCACVGGVVDIGCTDDGDGAVTVTYGGG